MPLSESSEVRTAAALALAEPDRSWQVWLRVRLGTERRIDVARAFGYRDGSAITQIIKCREAEAAAQPELSGRMLHHPARDRSPPR